MTTTSWLRPLSRLSIVAGVQPCVWPLALVATSCLAPAPREPYVEPTAAAVERVALGTSIDMETTAITGCRTESTITGIDFTWDKPSKEGPSLGFTREHVIVGCRGQSVEATLFCRPRDACDAAEDEQRGHGGLSLAVLLTRTGNVTVQLEINNLEAGTHETKVRSFDVVPPDAFRLQCFTPALAWGSCEHGVAAAQPSIRVWPMLDGKLVRTRLLRVNGYAGTTSTSFTNGQSLEPILGGGPVQPGTYDLDFELGEMRQRVSITVR